MNAYAMLGLLEAAGAAKRDKYAAAAEAIGSLILQTFGDDPARLLEYGNHQGLSALIVLEPLAILARRAGGERFAAFAMGLVEAAEEKLGLLCSPIDRIGTGKIYQLLWVLDGLACLAHTTSDDQLLEAVIRHWKAVHEHHLSPIGGPWGGVAGHKEVFNPPHFFDPSGLIETCSVMSWMSLSRRLFALTKGQQYLDAYHRSLWNVLLGAADPNGEDWIYFSFPNGQRNATYHWACCRSSGALALEDAAEFAVEEADEEIIVNLAMPLKGALGGTEFELQVSDDWQEFRLIRQAGSRPIRVRLPSFAGGGDRLLPSEDQAAEWTVPQPVRPLYQAKHLDHHGQTIVHDDYVAVERGPYVYAAGLIEGYRKQETLRIPRLNASDHFRIAGAEEITLILAGHAPIKMEPYYKAGGRGQGTWRAVWLQAAWQ